MPLNKETKSNQTKLTDSGNENRLCLHGLLQNRQNFEWRWLSVHKKKKKNQIMKLNWTEHWHVVQKNGKYEKREMLIIICLF